MKLYGVIRALHRPTFCQRESPATARALALEDNDKYAAIGPHIPVEIDVPDEWFRAPNQPAGPTVRRLDR